MSWLIDHSHDAYEGALTTSIAAEDAGSKQHSSGWPNSAVFCNLGKRPNSSPPAAQPVRLFGKTVPIRPVSFFHKTTRKSRFAALPVPGLAR
jgi:hypothetical protein